MGIENKNQRSLYERLSTLEGPVRRVINHGSSKERIVEITVHTEADGKPQRISVRELDGSDNLISTQEIGEDGVMRPSVVDLKAEHGSPAETMGEERILEAVERALEQYESRRS